MGDAPVEEQIRQVFDQVIEAQKTQLVQMQEQEQANENSDVLLEDQEEGLAHSESFVEELAPVEGVIIVEERHADQPPADMEAEKDLDEVIEQIMELEKQNEEDSAYRNN